ncbi:MAG: DUF1501 domain-containing protein [Phycisphaerae bacterium]|nr:DUF1501 domain-containing protein [Phycisphaerae bacterium]
MLTLSDDAYGRRDFFRIGSLGSLALPALLQAEAAAANKGRPVTGKSVIFVFMHGGPPQTETFDPKMNAPTGIRSATGELKTSLPGVTFGTTFPRLARLADKMAVVRSFRPGDGNHDIKPVVSRHSLGANVGSIYSHIAGVTHPRTGVPRSALLFPRSVDANAQPGNDKFGRFSSAGDLGAAYAPFTPSGDSKLKADMNLWMPRRRLDDRRALLNSLDQARGQLESAAAGSIDRFNEQAYDLILRGVSRAFDLSKEDPRVLARYDTAPLVHPDRISRKWNNHRNYRDHGQCLGKQMLLARRLVEAGCGFVTVTTNFVWDMHADKNNATIEEGMDYVGGPFDHAMSALVEDLHRRGLGEKVLVVACGEMGRTPKINKNGGRDHWGGLAPLLLYGGGLKMGQVIGQSSRDAGEPAAGEVGIPNLLATILHTILDVGELRLDVGLPDEIQRLVSAASPIRGLL